MKLPPRPSPQQIIIFILAALLTFSILQVKTTQSQLVKTQAQAATLPDGAQCQIDIRGSQVIYKQRAPGEGAIKLKEYYLPPEGGFNLMQNAEGKIDLYVDNMGFTFKLFAGGALSLQGKGGLAAGARFAYYSRYGLGAGAVFYDGKTRPIIVLDRRLNDVSPLIQNTSAAAYIGYDYLGFGLQIYL